MAYALRYSNPSHFITAFKKQYGVTPKKYLMGK
ncbi:MAG: AraC family transcriptional regulator [Saprospiraceae bacterium]|nr:AraC family transcriptional regulator [Saprospiraceae bacterium]